MERLKRLAAKISADTNVNFIDYQIFSERHLIRIAYTINEKSKHLAIGIDPFWDMEKIAKYSIKGQIAHRPIQLHRFRYLLYLCSLSESFQNYIYSSISSSLHHCTKVQDCPEALAFY